MRFDDVLGPALELRPWRVPDKVQQREQVIQAILNGGACETPPALALQAIDRLRRLDHPAFDIMRLVQDDAFPLVLVESRFS